MACRYQWLRRQGLRENAAAPCGTCGPCTRYGIPAASDAATIADDVRSALASGDRDHADRLLRRATHAGIRPVDLFEAGGRPRRRTSAAKAADES